MYPLGSGAESCAQRQVRGTPRPRTTVPGRIANGKWPTANGGFAGHCARPRAGSRPPDLWARLLSSPRVSRGSGEWSAGRAPAGIGAVPPPLAGAARGALWTLSVRLGHGQARALPYNASAQWFREPTRRCCKRWCESCACEGTLLPLLRGHELGSLPWARATPKAIALRWKSVIGRTTRGREDPDAALLTCGGRGGRARSR